MGSLIEYRRRPNTGVRGGGVMLQEARAPAKDTGTLIRSSELSKMLGLIRDDGPRLMYVHGIAGIGKSTLLSSFATAARTSGVTSDDSVFFRTPNPFLWGHYMGRESRARRHERT